MLDKECAEKIQLTTSCSLKDAVSVARQQQVVKAQLKEQLVSQYVEDQNVKMADKGEVQKMKHHGKKQGMMDSKKNNPPSANKMIMSRV